MSVVSWPPDVDAIHQLASEIRTTLTNDCGRSDVVDVAVEYFDNFTRCIGTAKSLLDGPALAHRHGVRNEITAALINYRDALLRLQIRLKSFKPRMVGRLSRVVWFHHWASNYWASLVDGILVERAGSLLRVLSMSLDDAQHKPVVPQAEELAGAVLGSSPEVPTGDNAAGYGSRQGVPLSRIASREQILRAGKSLQPRYLPFVPRQLLRGSVPRMHPYGAEINLAITRRAGECHVADQEEKPPSGWVAGAVIHVDLLSGPYAVAVELVSVDPVARGASGTVYKGRLGSALLALKVFPGQLDGEKQKLLARELRYAKRLRHEHILPFIGTAVYEQRTIIASPFMANGNMLHYLLSHRYTRRLELIIQVAQALEYLHSKEGLAHGDLKCENVLISGQGTALLADFGLSTSTDSSDENLSTSSDAQIQNTLAFAAPELLFGDVENTSLGDPAPPQPKTRETDIYAFGMLIIQAFTTKAPWHGYHAGQIIGLVYKGTPHPRPARDALMDELSDYLWEHCRSCWARNPENRPTIVEVKQKLWSEQSTRYGRVTYDGVEHDLVLRDYRDVMPAP